MTATKLFLHPDYARNFEQWQIAKELYEGDEAIIKQTKYTPQFVVEEGEAGKKAYLARLNRTFYTNLLEPIISTWLGWLFSKPPNYDAVLDIFDGDDENIDGCGKPLSEFLYDMGVPYLLFGKAYLSVETPNVDSLSPLDDKALGLRPYAKLWNPMEVPDWIKSSSFANYGSLRSIDFHYSEIAQRLRNTDKPIESLVRRSMYLEGNKVLTTLYMPKPVSDQQSRDISKQLTVLEMNKIESDWVVKSEGQIDIDEIPVIQFGCGSWVKDCIPEIRRHHILVCSYENILHYQAYKKTFISGEPLKDSPLNIAENAIIWLKQDSSVTESAAENPAGLEARIASVTDTIFKVAFNQLRQVPGTSKAVQSDSTIREEKEPQIAAAKTAIMDLENAANEMVRLWAKYKNKEYNPEKRIVFNKEFTVQDSEELLSQYAQLKDRIGKIASWEKALLKKVAASQEYSKEEMEAINQDIETLKIEQPKLDLGARLQASLNG